MCGDCWNAAMGAPVALAMGRYAWVGYRDRLPGPFRRRPRADEGSPAPDRDPEAPSGSDVEAPVPADGAGPGASPPPDPGGGPGRGDDDLVGAPG